MRLYLPDGTPVPMHKEAGDKTKESEAKVQALEAKLEELRLLLVERPES